MMRVVRYLVKFHHMNDARFPKGSWKLSMKPQKNYKSKLLATGWMIDIRKWFGRWTVNTYVDQAEAININAFEASLLSAMWDKWMSSEKRTKLEYYYMNIINIDARSVYLQQGARAQDYITTPMPTHVRSAFAHFCMPSHSLAIESGAWLHIPHETHMC